MERNDTDTDADGARFFVGATIGVLISLMCGAIVWLALCLLPGLVIP